MFRSATLSDQMPVAGKPLWKFEDYTTADGKKALSIRVDIRDMGKYYAPDPRLRNASCFSYSWSARGKTEYIPRVINNASDALNVMDTFNFPEEIRSEARRQARLLSDVFREVNQSVMVRDLPSGRLDRRKLPEIARELHQGALDLDHLLPYQRRIPLPAKQPTVAIVASAGNVEMWHDKDYIPRATILSLAVLWACETAGLNAYAALCQGHLRPHGYQKVQLGAILAAPGQRISPNAYAVTMHSDLWRYGFMTCQAADYEANGRHNMLQGDKGNRPSSVGCNFPVENGGLAVDWARQMLSADLVISIGKNEDRSKADIALDSKFKIPDACAEIARQAKKLTRKA